MHIKNLFFLTFLHCLLSSTTLVSHNFDKFVLITSLYNETNQDRVNEYIGCLEINLKHNSIKQIHVIYDTSRDDQSNTFLQYLKTQNVKITYMSKRPSFGDCFKLVNQEYPNSRIMIANADIFFNDTLNKLDTYDLTNKFLALTRWNVSINGTITIFEQGIGSFYSQDVWIFNTPIRKFKDDAIGIGTLQCDNAIAYQAIESGLVVTNPCLSIQCCHLHITGIHNYETYTGTLYSAVPWVTL